MPTAERPTKLAPRRDIQALRTVAVGAVVIYHLFPQQLPGGFVGVDVFFVISGYLITLQLTKELAATGRVSFVQFWARRIRRLLPAAFTVLAACVVALVLLMPQVTWQDNLKQIGASAAYVQNWVLASDAIDYLRAENSPSLTQHYWSLSVEEQFYVFWPLLLAVAAFASHRLAALSRRTATLAVLGTVATGSFVTSVLLTASNAPLAFFATQTRAWEFAAGALLTLLPAALAPRLRRGLAWFGLVVVVVSCFAISGSSAFPGAIALMPVAGAALFLAGDDLTGGPLVRARAVQWLGDHSYGIYLWHWPPIVAAPWVLGGAPSWRSKLVILAGTLVLAFLTKTYVEEPVRTGRRWTSRPRYAYAFAAAGSSVLLLVATVGYTHVGNGSREAARTALARVTSGDPCFGAPAMLAGDACRRPFARPAELNTAFAAEDVFDPARLCQQRVPATTAKLCAFGETRAPRHTMVVVGNSHAVHFVAGLDLFGKRNGWKVLLAAKTDCLGVITVPVGTITTDNPCISWSRSVQHQLLNDVHADVIVFASHANAIEYLAGAGATAASVRAADAAILQTWQALRRTGARLMVVHDVPGTRPVAAPACIASSTATYDPCSQPRKDLVLPDLLSSLALAHPELVTNEDLTKYFCDATTCHGLIGDVVVYSDSHHISATYSRSLGRYLGADIAALV